MNVGHRRSILVLLVLMLVVPIQVQCWSYSLSYLCKILSLLQCTSLNTNRVNGLKLSVFFISNARYTNDDWMLREWKPSSSPHSGYSIQIMMGIKRRTRPLQERKWHRCVNRSTQKHRRNSIWSQTKRRRLHCGGNTEKSITIPTILLADFGAKSERRCSSQRYGWSNYSFNKLNRTCNWCNYTYIWQLNQSGV